MLELYTSEPNTFFLKPLVALAEKRVSCTHRYFDPAKFEQFAADFPSGLESRLQLEREGPILVHDGTIVSSSFFMLEYISEALPGASLVPADAYDAYRARAWGQFLGAHLGSAVPVLGCAKYLARRLAADDPAEIADHIAKIEPVERRAGWQAIIDGTYSDAYLDNVRARLAMPVARVETRVERGPVARRPLIFGRRHRRLRDAQLPARSRADRRERRCDATHQRVSAPHRCARIRCAKRCSPLVPGGRRSTSCPGIEASRWG